MSSPQLASLAACAGAMSALC
jgi:hypothetical protein